MADYKKTALPDRLMLRGAYELSYAAFEKSFMAKFGELPKPVLDRVLSRLGSGSIADIHRKTVLRLPLLLAGAEGVSDEAIAASMLFGAAKEDETIMDYVDRSVAAHIRKFLNWERRLDASLQGGLSVHDAMASAFARSVAGEGALTPEDNTLMKGWAIVRMELIERVAGSDRPDGMFGAVASLAAAIARQTASGPSALDSIFTDTLIRTRRAIAPASDGPAFDIYPG